MGLSCREMAKKKVGFLFFQFEEKKFGLPTARLPAARAGHCREGAIGWAKLYIPSMYYKKLNESSTILFGQIRPSGQF